MTDDVTSMAVETAQGAAHGGDAPDHKSKSGPNGLGTGTHFRFAAMGRTERIMPSVRGHLPSYVIQVADTAELQRAVFQLRYEVFALEFGDGRYADHENKIWCDEDDGPYSTIVIALDGSGTAIGTMRLTRWSDWDFIGKQVYGLDLLSRQLGVDVDVLQQTSARVDRACLATAWRGTTLLVDLQEYVESLALLKGCNTLLGVPGTDNIRSRRAFSRLGWREYPVQAEYRGFKAQLIYKNLTID